MFYEYPVGFRLFIPIYILDNTLPTNCVPNPIKTFNNMKHNIPLLTGPQMALMGLSGFIIWGGYLYLQYHIKWDDEMMVYELFLYRILLLEVIVPRIIIPIAYVANRKDVRRFFWMMITNQ